MKQHKREKEGESRKNSSMPEVEAVDMEHLFDGDVFIFAATKAIPAVGSDVKDVRMAQLEANAGIVAHSARMARWLCPADHRWFL